MKGVPRGIEFWLIKSSPDRWIWTVFLPTQRNGFKTRVDAEDAMAQVVDKIINKKFKVVEHDMDAGAERDYMGGIPQLLRNYVFALARKPSPPNTKRAVKKQNSKPSVRGTAKRNKGKKLPRLRTKSSRTMSGSARKG